MAKAEMCTKCGISHSHYMLISHLSQQRWRRRWRHYIKPTRLPNSQLQFESHHWLFVRTHGVICSHFSGNKTGCFLRRIEIFPSGYFSLDDQLHPWTSCSNRYLKPNQAVFFTHFFFFFLPIPKQSISTALWQKRNRKFNLNKWKHAT